MNQKKDKMHKFDIIAAVLCVAVVILRLMDHLPSWLNLASIVVCLILILYLGGRAIYLIRAKRKKKPLNSPPTKPQDDPPAENQDRS